MQSPPGTDLDFALHGRFLRGLALSPDNVAIRVGRQELTYTQLHTRALILAGNLAAKSEEKLTSVGVLTGRTPGCYIGILAALYAGATVVPLNPDYPVGRTVAMTRAASVNAIVVDESSTEALAKLSLQTPGIPALMADVQAPPQAGLTPAWPDPALGLPAPVPVRPSDVAYIQFTSGSTGRPKGVQITHANADHFLRTNQERYQLGPQDVVSQTSDTTFDLAIFDLFMAWGAGARLVATPPYALLALPDYVQRHRLTCWFSVPSAIAIARRMGGLKPASMPSLRWSLFCGEPLAARDAREWQAAACNAIVENLYGPTELTVACSAYRWSDADSPSQCVNGIVPIGHLYPGLSGLLLGREDEIDGAEGELCVTGPQLFPGYLSAADGEGKFVQHGDRSWYRTGDLVRETAGAGYAFLGRVDHQVKIGGCRVEPLEVESAVRDLAGVEEAAVVAIPREGTSELAVFYRGADLPRAAVIDGIAQVLPPFMMPRWIWRLDELPLNNNRKVDRPALVGLAQQCAAGDSAGPS